MCVKVPDYLKTIVNGEGGLNQKICGEMKHCRSIEVLSFDEVNEKYGYLNLNLNGLGNSEDTLVVLKVPTVGAYEIIFSGNIDKVTSFISGMMFVLREV